MGQPTPQRTAIGAWPRGWGRCRASIAVKCSGREQRRRRCRAQGKEGSRGGGQASLPTPTDSLPGGARNLTLPPTAGSDPRSRAAPAERSLPSLFLRLGNGPLLLSPGREAQSTAGRTRAECASGPALYSARVNARGLGGLIFEFHLELFQPT